MDSSSGKRNLSWSASRPSSGNILALAASGPPSASAFGYSLTTTSAGVGASLIRAVLHGLRVRFLDVVEQAFVVLVHFVTENAGEHVLSWSGSAVLVLLGLQICDLPHAIYNRYVNLVRNDLASL